MITVYPDIGTGNARGYCNFLARSCSLTRKEEETLIKATDRDGCTERSRGGTEEREARLDRFSRQSLN